MGVPRNRRHEVLGELRDRVVVGGTSVAFSFEWALPPWSRFRREGYAGLWVGLSGTVLPSARSPAEPPASGTNLAQKPATRQQRERSAPPRVRALT
jgi:hypothetical protein